MNSRNVHLLLPADELAALDAVAHEGFHTRSRLVSNILRQWLRSPRPKLLPADPKELLNEQRKIAAERRRVVLAWREAVKRAKARKQGKDAATARFLAELQRHQGLKLTRATLYNWARAYRDKGLAGLTDKRRTPKGDRGRVEAASKSLRSTI